VEEKSMNSHSRKFAPLISALVDDELEEGRRRQLEEHMSACAECKGLYDDFLEMREMSRGVARYSTSPHYLTRLRAELDRSASFVRGASAVEAMLFGPLLAILVIALIFLIGVVEKEKTTTTDEYLYFGGRQTLVEYQILSHRKPLSKEDVLMLTVVGQRGEEASER
jgi:predicted anti-sigma-YlaC factor YlaD